MTTTDAAPTTRRRPANRKAEIVDTARRLAASDGAAAVSMEDIAKEVGITAGALYRHFAGRDALFEAVRADTVERFVSVAQKATDEKSGIRAITAATVTLALDDPTLMRVRNRRSTPSTDADRRLMKLWSDAVVVAVPAMSRAEARLRQDCVAAAIAESTWRPGSVARPQLDELLTTSCIAVLLTPAIPPARSEPEAQAKSWFRQPSRQEQILGAALALFRTKGFAGTTMDDIGKAVGLAASGIYRTYDQKADILLDAYDRVAARVEVGAEAALAHSTSPADALSKLALNYAEVALDNPDLIIVTAREAPGLDEYARRRIGRRNRSLRDAWVSVLTQTRPDLTDSEARLLHRGALALANQGALSKGESTQEIAALMLAFLTPTPQTQSTQGETT